MIEGEPVTGEAGKWLALIDIGSVPIYVNDLIFDKENEEQTIKLMRELPCCHSCPLVSVHHCRPRIPALAALSEDRNMNISSGRQSATPQETNTEPTIVLRGISKWFGSVVAVNNVSLQVYPGITGLLGPNGAGKTTLLHMIAGLIKAFGGRGKPAR